MLSHTKDEPYVAQTQNEFRARDKSKEINKVEFRVRSGGHKNLAPSQSIRALIADRAVTNI